MTNDRERHFGKLLCRYLSDQDHKCNYTDGPDPPDLIFTVDTQIWAVEHTRLEDRVKGAKRDISRTHCTEADLKIRSNLINRLRNDFKGSWYLQIMGPMQWQDRRNIEEAAYAAIRTDDPNLFRRILKVKAPTMIDDTFGNDSATLHRSADSGDSIVCGSGLSSSSVEPLHVVCEKSISYMISNKESILTPLRNQYDEIVLLLEDRITFGGPQRIKKVIDERKPELGWVDRIYLAVDGRIEQIY